MKTVYTYPHTHWDFEWYFSYNESTIQLIYHMDDVIKALQTGTLESYVLDGQLSILEDYLRFAPDKENIIKELVSTGKLIIGPWYTQTDELIISGESIVRNLFYGIKASEKFGDFMKIGYLPDSFGQSKDMPKILNGCGIKNSVFWRGVSQDQTKGREFRWASEDGSEVLVYNIKNGYFYGGEAMMVNDDVNVVEETINKSSTEDIILFPIGSDQRKVDLNYKERLEFYNKETKNDFVYKDCTPEWFFKELEKRKGRLDLVSGEFISASDSKIHHSIYSSRYDHKYLNDKVERRLINILEPLTVMSQNLGIKANTNMLAEIWKVFVRNHAHDSACGCNTDKTNKIILSRLEEVDQLSYSAMDYILRKMSISMSGSESNDVFVFNTLPIDKVGNVEVKLSTKNKKFELYNEEGQRVEYEIIEFEKVYGGTINKNESDNDPKQYYYVTKICINVNIKALNILKLKVKELSQEIDKIIKRNEVVNSNCLIEDNFFKVEYKDGKCNLYDKNRDKYIEDFITIENSGDDGDTYDYSPPEFDRYINYDFSNSKVEQADGELVKTIKMSGNWLLPKNLEQRKNCSCTEVTPYKFEIKLLNNGMIECYLKLDNNSDDHRLRVIIKTDIYSENSIANTQFGTVERENNPPHMNDWKEIGWKEEPTPIYPMINYAGIKNESGSAIAFAKGIKEYEIIENKNIALTLFRSVGYLGKPDLIRRPGSASGNQFKYIETPDSQLHKTLKFKFAICLSNEFNPVDTYNRWIKYAIWTPYYQMEELNVFTNTLKYFKVNKLDNELNTNKFCDFKKLGNVVVSSVIPMEDDSYVIRLFNPNTDMCNGGSVKLDNLKRCELVNLIGESINELKVENNDIILGNFKQGEIKTVRIYI